MSYTNLFIIGFALVCLFLAIEWRLEIGKLERVIKQKELELYNTGEVNSKLRIMFDAAVIIKDEKSKRLEFLREKFKIYIAHVDSNFDNKVLIPLWEELKREFTK